MVDDTDLGPGSTPLVRTEGVYKRFGDHEVLSGVDFELRPSEVACLIGPSGSGKTTFLRCINQLEVIDGGRIWVDGELIGFRAKDNKLIPLAERDIVRQRAQVGMVFQHFNLFPHLTILDNLTIAQVHVANVNRDEAIERAMKMLVRVGLAEKRDSYPAQLSGGQQQRVAIARAITMRPKLMLFDEPTSSLDPELVGEVLDVMRDLAAGGTTMIVATHEMRFARDVADKIVFMDGGRIIEAGPPVQVFDNPQTPRLATFLSKISKGEREGS